MYAENTLSIRPKRVLFLVAGKALLLKEKRNGRKFLTEHAVHAKHSQAEPVVQRPSHVPVVPARRQMVKARGQAVVLSLTRRRRDQLKRVKRLNGRMWP